MGFESDDELRKRDSVFKTYSFGSFNIDGEDGVTSGGGVIHGGLADHTKFVTLSHQLFDFWDRFNGDD